MAESPNAGSARGMTVPTGAASASRPNAPAAGPLSAARSVPSKRLWEAPSDVATVALSARGRRLLQGATVAVEQAVRQKQPCGSKGDGTQGGTFRCDHRTGAGCINAAVSVDSQIPTNEVRCFVSDALGARMSKQERSRTEPHPSPLPSRIRSVGGPGSGPANRPRHYASAEESGRRPGFRIWKFSSRGFG
jgi:hypothetical protein